MCLDWSCQPRHSYLNSLASLGPGSSDVCMSFVRRFSLRLLHGNSSSIMPTRPRTKTATKPSRRKPAKRKTGRRRKQSYFLRILRSLPSWLLWLSGIVLVGLYAFFLYYIFVGPFSLRWQAQFGTVPEPEGYEVRGIDISHYQKDVDWAKVKEAKISNQPLRFVIIKATEGVSIRDVNFGSNIQQARRMNIITGAYHFFIPGSNARKQAQYFINNVSLMRGDLPPILDVEKAGNLDDRQLQNDVLTWLEIVEDHYGVRPIIYANYDFKLRHLDTPIFNQYPLWIARYYQEDLGYDGAWSMWQYTDVGQVDGIKGQVDCNVFNGTLHELLQMCIK